MHVIENRSASYHSSLLDSTISTAQGTNGLTVLYESSFRSDNKGLTHRFSREGERRYGVKRNMKGKDG